MTGQIKAVCTSTVRGTQKRNIQTADFTTDWGLVGDAHGGDWHRQVSLISYEKIQAFNAKGASVNHGDFGENIVAEGIDFKSLPIGTRLLSNDCILEITQIGKECNNHCQIYTRMGDCIMPREGVFAKVIQNGVISCGDYMTAVTGLEYTAAVLTLSDRGFKGEREDESGKTAVSFLEAAGYIVLSKKILPDNRKEIEEFLINVSDKIAPDILITTGGTGFSPRDVTPEATLAVAHRLAPGISEGIRANSPAKAMLSRGASVIRGKTLIINLPGSPAAVRESLEYVLPHLRHGIDVLRGEVLECVKK